MKEELNNEIAKYIKRAELLRSINAQILHNVKLLDNITKFYISVGSGISTTLIFSKIPDTYFLHVGVFSCSVFLVSLIPSTFEFSKKINERIVTMNLLTRWIRDAEHFQKFDINNDKNKYTKLVESYQNIMETHYFISDKKFLRLKKKFILKSQISKELEVDPNFKYKF